MALEESTSPLDSAVPKDLSTLFHECTGCSFCAWRNDHPVNLGWEQLLSKPVGSNSLYGVELSNSQIEDPTTELSIQQTADYLVLSDDYVQDFDKEFEQI